jgi:hypothetical protein
MQCYSKKTLKGLSFTFFAAFRPRNLVGEGRTFLRLFRDHLGVWLIAEERVASLEGQICYNTMDGLGLLQMPSTPIHISTDVYPQF